MFFFLGEPKPWACIIIKPMCLNHIPLFIKRNKKPFLMINYAQCCMSHIILRCGMYCNHVGCQQYIGSSWQLDLEILTRSKTFWNPKPKWIWNLDPSQVWISHKNAMQLIFGCDVFFENSKLASVVWFEEICQCRLLLVVNIEKEKCQKSKYSDQ